MPTIAQMVERAGRGPLLDRRELRLDAAYERVNRMVDPNWNRQANQYKEPIDLLREVMGIGWIPGLHFEVLNETLLNLVRRAFTSLIVTMPPQHGKSTFVSKVFPAWYMGDNPTHNIILTAYNSDHAGEFGGAARDIVSDKGEQLGLRVDPLVSARRSWGVIEGGMLRAAGLNAGLTGKPCDLLIGDDPIKKPSEAFSPAYKKQIRMNWLQACETRLQPNGLRILVMTRWAYDDLAGWLIENQPDEWHVLHLEALCTNPEKDPMGRNMGEALWQHYNRETLLARRKRVGEYTFQTMYQGKPQKRAPDHEPYIPYDLLAAAALRDFSYSNPSPGERFTRAQKEARRQKQRFWSEQPLDMGCDVARSPKGDRLTFIALRAGKVVYKESKRGQRTTDTANEIIEFICNHKPRSVRIDDTGVGGGVTDRTIEIIDTATGDQFTREQLVSMKRCEIMAINFGGRAFNADLFADIRTEMWHNVREMLRNSELDLPEDEELFDDLTAPQEMPQAGRQKLESKAQMARRGVKSPDLGDALAMAAYPYDWFDHADAW